MRKHIFKSVIAMLAVFLIVALTVDTSSATQYKYTAGTAYKVTLPNGQFLYRFTFIGSGLSTQDTVLINLPAPFIEAQGIDTTLFRVNVYSSDSAIVGVRYRVSSDGSTYKSYTVGTDSTTWVPVNAAGAAAYNAGTTTSMATFVISAPQYAGIQPYNQIMVCGVNTFVRSLGGWVMHIVVDVIPVRQ